MSHRSRYFITFWSQMSTVSPPGTQTQAIPAEHLLSCPCPVSSTCTAASFRSLQDWWTWLQSENLAEVGLLLGLKVGLVVFLFSENTNNVCLCWVLKLLPEGLKNINPTSRDSLHMLRKGHRWQHQKNDPLISAVFYETLLLNLPLPVDQSWIKQLMSDLFSGCLNWRPYKFFSTLRIAKGSWESVPCSGRWLSLCCWNALRSNRPPAHQREEWVCPHQWRSGCGSSVHTGAIWEGEYHRASKGMCGQH